MDAGLLAALLLVGMVGLFWLLMWLDGDPE